LDPTSPYEVGCYDTRYYAYDVYISGSHAYVADGYGGLRIIDISDPTSPLDSTTLGTLLVVSMSQEAMHMLQMRGIALG